MLNKVEKLVENKKKMLEKGNLETMNKFKNLFLTHEKQLTEDHAEEKLNNLAHIGNFGDLTFRLRDKIVVVSLTAHLVVKHMDLYEKLNEDPTITAILGDNSVIFNLKNEDSKREIRNRLTLYVKEELYNDSQSPGSVIPSLSTKLKERISNNQERDFVDIAIYEILHFKEVVMKD